VQPAFLNSTFFVIQMGRQNYLTPTVSFYPDVYLNFFLHIYTLSQITVQFDRCLILFCYILSFIRDV
jgi:hypothetical protein